jgi:hypothetical protein
VAELALTVPGSVLAPGTGRRVVIVHPLMSVTLTAVDPASEHRGGLPEWASIDRPNTVPLYLKRGDRLRELRLTAHLFSGAAVDSPAGPVADAIRLLFAIARLAEPVGLYYGNLEAGVWLITDIDVRARRRDPETNDVNWCELDLEFVEHRPAPVPVVAIPELTPTVTPPTPPPPAAPSPGATPAAPGPRTHTVVRGDTLWALAGLFYGDHLQWRRLADANAIRDPRRMAVGTKLTIP